MVLADIDQIIQRMEDAVDVVLHSEHATSQVAACVFHPASDARPSAAYNERPAPLKPHYAWDDRLGASSQFVHAELAALSRFYGPWEGAHVCVTDPFCPNCAKNMAEAGVRAIFIDHKGFQKDFIERNGDEFKNMSMLIAEKAGISVYMVNRRGGAIVPILEQATLTRPSPGGIEFFDVTPDMTLSRALETFRARLGTAEAWTLAFVTEGDGSTRGMLVFEALPYGFTPDDFLHRNATDTGKYRFPIDPLTRLLVNARRMGFTIKGNLVASAQVPSSRALVNALEFGLQGLILASKTPDHDPSGAATLEDLCNKSILQASSL